MRFLNKRNAFRKGVTVSDLIEYLTDKLDDDCSADLELVDVFADEHGIATFELRRFCINHGCDCDCGVMERLLAHSGIELHTLLPGPGKEGITK